MGRSGQFILALPAALALSIVLAAPAESADNASAQLDAAVAKLNNWNTPQAERGAPCVSCVAIPAHLPARGIPLSLSALFSLLCQKR